MQKTFTQLYKEKLRIPRPSGQFIKEIAALTGKDRSTVRCWIDGNTQPLPDVQEKIAEHLGIPAHVLFPPRHRKNHQALKP